MRRDVTSGPDPEETEYLWVLRHIHDLDKVHRDIKGLGLFSSLASARPAIRVAMEIPGFRDAPEGFQITPVEVCASPQPGQEVWLVLRTFENEDLEDEEMDVPAAFLDEQEANDRGATLEGVRPPRPCETYWAQPYLVDEQLWMHGYITLPPGDAASSDLPFWILSIG
jgi:hypothetical protein